MFFCYFSPFSGGESAEHAEKETNVYWNRNKEEETSTEGKRDKGSQEFIDISEVLRCSWE